MIDGCEGLKIDQKESIKEITRLEQMIKTLLRRGVYRYEWKVSNEEKDELNKERVKGKCRKRGRVNEFSSD